MCTNQDDFIGPIPSRQGGNQICHRLAVNLVGLDGNRQPGCLKFLLHIVGCGPQRVAVMRVALTYTAGKFLNMPPQICLHCIFRSVEGRQGPLIRDSRHLGVQRDQYDGSGDQDEPRQQKPEQTAQEFEKTKSNFHRTGDNRHSLDLDYDQFGHEKRASPGLKAGIVRKRFFSVLLCMVTLPGVWTSAISGSTEQVDRDWPAWADEEELDRQRIAAINEGELVFLQKPPPGTVHHHRSRILIARRSLTDGWVRMEQCHERLSQVEEAQIVFTPGRTRALEIQSFRNMDAAFVESNTIQLRGIREASQICARLETRALHDLGMQRFELRNGPFMRRFLDGYFPLQLSLRIEYPPDLELVDFTPEDQPGCTVSLAPGLVTVEALFEGELRTRFRFVDQ